MTGQYDCRIIPSIQVRKEQTYMEKINDQPPKPYILYNIELTFAGYTFKSSTDSFDFAFQMKTDFENKFKILRRSEEGCKYD